MKGRRANIGEVKPTKEQEHPRPEKGISGRPGKSGFAETLVFSVIAAFLFIGAAEDLFLLVNRWTGLACARSAALLFVFGTGVSLLGALGVLLCLAAVWALAKAALPRAVRRAAAWTGASRSREALLLTIPFLPVYLYLCPALFEGAGIREKLSALAGSWGSPFPPGPVFTMTAFLAAAGATWIALLALTAGAGRRARAGRCVSPFPAGPAVLLLACLAATWINCTFALRIYDKIHAALGALALIASAVSFGAIHRLFFKSRRRSRYWRGAVALLALLGFAAVLFLFARFHAAHNVAHLMAQWCPVQSSVIRSAQQCLRAARAEPLLTLLPRAEPLPPLDGLTGGWVPEQPSRHNLLPDNRRWNVLFILVDSLRPDRIGALGHGAASTPNIDEIAARGVVFLKCYSQGVFTGSSLPAIFNSAPIPFLIHRDPEKDFTTLVDIVKGKGYRTFSLYPFYSQHSAHRVEHHSAQGTIIKAFHTTSFERGRRAQDGVLAGYLRGCAGKREGPFFIYWHLTGPRTLFESHLTASREEALRDYDRKVGAEDERIGRAMALLRELSLGESTIVVLTSDHGEELLDHGAAFHGTTVYNEQTHVPLIFAVPGVEPRAVRQPVASVDILPTLLDLLNVSTDIPMYGRSLVPCMKGEELREKPVFSFAGDHYWAVVEGDWKLIWDRVLGFIELYDLAEDPREQRNLAQADPGRAAAMKGRLLRILARQGELATGEAGRSGRGG